MKNLKTLFFALTGVLLLFGSGNAWGGTSPETITFSDADWKPWTKIKSGSGFESSSPNRGVANNGVSGSCISTTSFSNVTKIEVVASSNTTGGKVAIKIGDTQIADKSIAKSNNATYTYDASDLSTISALSGKITLAVTKPSSKTVYVKSVTITYASAKTAVKYDANGKTLKSGSSLPDDVSADAGKDYTVSTATVEADGYTFKGWNTDKNATAGIETVPAASMVANETVTLYAIWESAGPSCAASPSVSAGSISDATANSLTFSCFGGITSLGSDGCSIAEYGYVYGTSENPTTDDTKYQVGTSYTTTSTAFTAYTATNLKCGTTYYMRPYAINGNGTAYGTQALLSTSACPVDHFIDDVQGTTGYTGDGKAVSAAFTKASVTLADKEPATTGSCEQVHYHFVGWVTADDKASGNVDDSHIVNFQAEGNVPTNTTYYAVWAKEKTE